MAPSLPTRANSVFHSRKNETLSIYAWNLTGICIHMAIARNGQVMKFLEIHGGVGMTYVMGECSWNFLGKTYIEDKQNTPHLQ